jgi:hypothetical protein
MAESITKSRSESMDEISHPSLIERHRSPSATEVAITYNALLMRLSSVIMYIKSPTDTYILSIYVFRYIPMPNPTYLIAKIKLLRLLMTLARVKMWKGEMLPPRKFRVLLCF